MPETGTLTIILIVLILITLGLALYNLIMTLKLKKKYVEYMTKVGDGQDITNVLKNYVEDVTIVKGSDLCFALALLDFEDSGVVINGVYSRDNTTNTYAKPIEKGKSKYTLVKEEEEALNIAKQNGYKYFIDVDTGKQKLENK